MFGIGVEFDSNSRQVVVIKTSASLKSLQIYDIERQPIKINSVISNKTTGGITAAQIKPDQRTTTTHDITGLEVSPRVNDAGAGALNSIKADVVLKTASAARTVSALKCIEANIDFPGSGSAYTITNDVSVLRAFGDFGAGHTFSGKKNIVEVATPNTSGWDYLFNLKLNSGLEYNSAQGSADKKLKVLINAIDYHIPLHLASDHTRVETDVDGKTVRINSRNYTQTSGSSIGLQSKPSQTVTSTGDVIGAEFSPRANDAGAGAIIAMKADPVVKDATSARTVSAVRGVEINIDLPNAGSVVTFSNDISAIRTFLDAGAGHTFSGKKSVILVATPNTAGWDYFADLETNSGCVVVASVGGSQDRKLKIRDNGTDYFIPLHTS